MNETLAAIQQQLIKVVAQLRNNIPNEEPFGIAHNNWTFPELTRGELIEIATAISDRIDDSEVDDLGASQALINDYIRRLQYLQSNTLQNI